MTAAAEGQGLETLLTRTEGGEVDDLEVASGGVGPTRRLTETSTYIPRAAGLGKPWETHVP